MIPILLTQLIILSTPASTPNVTDQSQADRVYHCDFEEPFDRNFDNWPDDWTRRRGQGFPFYLPIGIVDDDSRSPSRRSLKIELDGGAAQIYSPRIRVSPSFSYVLHASLKTEGLRHNVAYCAVSFLDENHQKLETYTSEKLNHTGSWRQLQIGPVTPKHQAARWATIELHLEPTEKADLVGAAWFDDLWLGALPRMSIRTNSPFNVFADSEEIDISCHVSGFSATKKVVRFELHDVEGEMILSEEVPLEIDSDLQQRPSDNPIDVAFAAHWTNPAIPQHGFYTARAVLAGESGTMIERSVKLAIIDDQPGLELGEFGWSLPRGDDPLSLRDLVGLMKRSGIHWVKFPIWYSGEDGQRADDLARFAEWLSSDHMRLVGVLDSPPDDMAQMFGEQKQLAVASVFVEPEIWRPAVDPVMTRLSLKVRWWQLGADRDTSFVNFPNLEQKIREIRSDLNRFGQEINLGFALRAIDQTPLAKDGAPWKFLSYTADPPLTATEVRTYFDENERDEFQRWMVLEPLPQGRYDLQTRAADLLLRMLAAKMQQLDGVFIPDPFDPETGLMTEQGMPTELLLVWRTTAMMISGAEYLGSIQLRNGSQNHFFVRGKEAVMVVWNEHPTEEVVYLGTDVQQVDLWGRKRTPAELRQDDFVRQVIPVSKLPTFVTGVNPMVARWRMEFKLETQSLASVFGKEQMARYRFTNTFDSSVGGTVTVDTPIIEESGATADVKLGPLEEQHEGFLVALDANINSGEQPIRADFSITGHQFSVYRTIRVGLGDIEIRLESQLDDKGGLIVKQQLVNNTDEFVSFNCLLFAQGRRRQRRQVYNLGRGTKTNYFVYPNGGELVGSVLRLRAEEIGGARILNHVYTAVGTPELSE